MALITEDGTGLPNAASYCDVATATAYHAARGNGNAWAVLSSDRKEQLLVLATEYMAIYSPVWKGSRVSAGQALDWPRQGVCAYGFDVPADAVPNAVAQACAALALKAIAGPLVPEAATAAGVKRKKLGPLETEYFEAPTVAPAAKRYTDVDRIVAGLLEARRRYSAPLVRG